MQPQKNASQTPLEPIYFGYVEQFPVDCPHGCEKKVIVRLERQKGGQTVKLDLSHET